ncbi:DNA adenine methylase [Psittacicella gerlachiana]|uniref:site-specific DNA-methyltransferase (adenine-specific) n=1 Tax=Psittacicella gerlachiana TaxID=2028574 RepID=A0A3A1YIH4_9GAMM|nr:DNA adenine methylase [Psittacicella gerlachiana]RIY36840.1 hypothetical protein CKF59_02175 [Psittacicella gerlachiana]
MFEINNRRYLGSKFKLLSFIQEIVDKHCKNCQTFVDLFAGTGVVANKFNADYQIMVNDILMSNQYAYYTFFAQDQVDLTKLEQIIATYNNLLAKDLEHNYYSENFGDTYLKYRQYENCRIYT